MMSKYYTVLRHLSCAQGNIKNAINMAFRLTDAEQLELQVLQDSVVELMNDFAESCDKSERGNDVDTIIHALELRGFKHKTDDGDVYAGTVVSINGRKSTAWELVTIDTLAEFMGY
jgi:hypothetical protein